MSFKDFMLLFSSMSEESIEEYEKQNKETIAKIDQAIAEICEAKK